MQTTSFAAPLTPAESIQINGPVIDFRQMNSTQRSKVRRARARAMRSKKDLGKARYNQQLRRGVFDMVVIYGHPNGDIGPQRLPLMEFLASIKTTHDGRISRGYSKR